MALDPARRSPRLLAVMGAFLLLPLFAACNDTGDDGDDDDDDDDDSMGRPAAVLIVSE
jgi:hypothetical protein